MGHIQVGKTNMAILKGEVDLRMWDEEELTRGMRRNKNGRFVGRPPKVVPKAIHDELVKRKLSRAYDLLNEAIVDAVLLLWEVVKDKRAADSDRIKASQLIMDRVMGRAPERIIIENEPPWAAALRNALVPVDGEPRVVSVIDADVVEVDDEDPFA